VSLSWSSESSGSKFLTRFESNQFFVARVGLSRGNHLGFGFGKFPLQIINVSIIFLAGSKKISLGQSKSTPVKDRPASYLLRVKSCLSRFKAHLYLWPKKNLYDSKNHYPVFIFTDFCQFLLCPIGFVEIKKHNWFIKTIE